MGASTAQHGMSATEPWICSLTASTSETTIASHVDPRGEVKHLAHADGVRKTYTIDPKGALKRCTLTMGGVQILETSRFKPRATKLLATLCCQHATVREATA